MIPRTFDRAELAVVAAIESCLRSHDDVAEAFVLRRRSDLFAEDALDEEQRRKPV